MTTKTTKAHIHLVKYFLAKGFVVSVFDGECWDTKQSSSYREIVESIDSVEECYLRIRENKGDKSFSWVGIVHDADFDETVYDYSANAIMTAWENEYNNYLYS
jgi:hypothetical protein